MKKGIFLALFLFCLTSCSNDDDSLATQPRANIVNPSFDIDKMIGAWSYKSFKVNGVVFNYEHNPNCEKDVFGFFNEETKPFDYEELVHVNDECSTEAVNFEWKVFEDQLEFYFDEQLVLAYTVISLTDVEFKVSYSSDFDNDGSIDDVEITAISEDPYGWFSD